MEKEEQRARNCLAQNDLTNFWQLWVQHQGYLYIRCLQWMGGNHADAQDALSSSMLKALDGISNCTREIVNAKGWLTRVTHNHCVDMQRSRQRLPITLPNLEEIPFSYDEIGLHFVETPEDSLFTKEMFAHIGRIFDDLPPRLREPTRLRFFGEMSYQDISEHLTISNENVRKRIQQARTIVRERLAKHL